MSSPEKRAPQTVVANIKSVAAMEAAFEEKRTFTDRVADAIAAFSGSMVFVAVHVVWFAAWLLINTGVVPVLPRFDPFPFILLAMIVSVEGVLLSTFVLMKQNRLQKRIDLRDQLNLQIDLLSEKEVTKSLQLLRAICRKLEIAEAEQDGELHEMADTTSVDMVAEQVQRELPEK